MCNSKHGNYRTLIFITVIILAFVVLLVACEKKRDSAPQQPAAETPVSISVALFKAPASDALQALFQEFTNETGINVTAEILPYADLKARVEQQFIAHSSRYDVIMADCIWIPAFAENGYLAELQKDAYQPNRYDFKDIMPALEDYLGKYPKNGKQYGMPFMSNTHMMAYRRSAVEPVAEKLGYKMPGDTRETAWTWDQYLAVAKAIIESGKGKNPELFGTSLQARSAAWIIYEWNGILQAFTATDTSRATGLPEFGDSAAQAMEYYAELYRYAPEDALTWGHEEETSAMCSGKTAMDATSNVELAANLIKPECTVNGGGISFAFPPVNKNGRGTPDMGGYGLLLSANSTHKKEASAFILWAASKEIHKRIVLNGGSPIRESEIQDSNVLAKFPYLTFYDKLIQDSVYRARIPQWPELEDVMARQLSSVLKGETTANQATTAISNWVAANLAKE